MIIRNSLTGAEFAAELKTEHCAGRPGERVVVVDGKAVEPQGLPRPWATALLNAL
jgi:hypothetical protein